MKKKLKTVDRIKELKLDETKNSGETTRAFAEKREIHLRNFWKRVFPN